MDEEAFVEGTEDIKYVNWEPPIFKITPYEIKEYGKINIKIGEYINFVVNGIFSCGFIISPFTNGDLTI